MEPIAICRTSRSSRSSLGERVMFIGLGVLAVISPLYINRRPVIESEDDEQSINLSSWLPLLLLLLILAIALSMYADKRFTRTSKFSSYERLVGIGMGLIAVISPLYINRRPDIDPELEEQSINLASWLPLLLLVLILAIALSLYLDQSLTRFDPYWIHRIGGSSGGIIIILVILALVLKCKASYGGKAE
ncbi:hypothetical protein P3X46_019715 [Hevea brasiliensis]|uniref:Uncharacterized protein n=2 Tax=Hevea brasiliensis TaxID=3981 RepID=A0ABQ9LNJ4_HEVBR|nr:uncharacterized protein LOC110662241 isoform X1 [Hevea brasiliensis]KAJ9168156.1 hypothetical protein P3X46_019715 [Hevea brasiliensis]